MRIVGLTGGIGSGKSTVSNLFKANGIPVVDADIVARDVLKKGAGGWKRVVAAFGQNILQANGEVDRLRLGQVVFSDPTKRQLLNQQLAPYISSGIFWEVLKLWMKGYKIIVLDIPLLFEAKMDRWTNPIIVVWVDPETQFQRLTSRDKTSEEDAKNRINAQIPLDWKRTKAEIVIDNTGSLEDLHGQFRKMVFSTRFKPPSGDIRCYKLHLELRPHNKGNHGPSSAPSRTAVVADAPPTIDLSQHQAQMQIMQQTFGSLMQQVPSNGSWTPR